jgi:hypothetical protein
MRNVVDPAPPSPAPRRRVLAVGRWPIPTADDMRDAQAVIAENIAKREARAWRDGIPLYAED